MQGAPRTPLSAGYPGGMPQTIYLVRHGETVWNREGRVQGHLDSPLTTRGLAQARRAGDTLRELIDDPREYTLLHSPLGRARQTAAIVAEILGWGTGACRQDPGLREMSWGEWEGLTTEEIARDEPARWAERTRAKWTFAPPAGESYAMLARRARLWLDSVATEAHLVAVAHSGFGRILRGIYVGLTPEQTLALDGPHDAVFRLARGSVARFDTESETSRAVKSPG